MAYRSYTIKEIIHRINANKDGLFLPTTQRPYVWGSRYEAEMYIKKLFDSLLRKYPIGGLIVWNTKEVVPFREFLKDYDESGSINGFMNKNVDEGLWGKEDKWLVYDGQQRLQTFYSCLKYTFNKKILFFDLLFDLESTELNSDETGFHFVALDEIKNLPKTYIRMTELFSRSPKKDFEYEEELINKNKKLPEDQRRLIRKNLKILWKTFVEEGDDGSKLVACFEISDKEEYEVNEIFQRINTGGIPLSNADLILSKIKEKYPQFEEELQNQSKILYEQTGYLFNVYSILQIMYLLIKDSIRVDPKKIKSSKELDKFKELLPLLKNPLREFIFDFLYKEFEINNPSIIPKKLALIPLIVYFYESNKKGVRFEKMSDENLKKMKQYLILSQINDWNIQGVIDEFCRIIRKQNKESKENIDFPLKEFISFLDSNGKRKTTISENGFLDYTWFSLKIITPKRRYDFSPNISGRFNPEIDHIFPLRLPNADEDYKNNVNILWNMQPIKGDINAMKLNKHPKKFFSSEEGKKYLGSYDHLPTDDLNDNIWTKPLEFISKRREKIISYLREEYGISFEESI